MTLFALMLYVFRRNPISSFAPLCFWMVLFGAELSRMSEAYGAYALFFGIGAGFAWQEDWHSRYLHPLWLIAMAALVFFTPSQAAEVSQRLAGMTFGLVALPFFLKKKMGSADVICLLAFGWILGFDRMCICVLMACAMGMICALALHLPDLPFVSFLLAGFWIALGQGYGLHARLMLLIAGSQF